MLWALLLGLLLAGLLVLAVWALAGQSSPSDPQPPCHLYPTLRGVENLWSQSSHLTRLLMVQTEANHSGAETTRRQLDDMKAQLGKALAEVSDEYAGEAYTAWLKSRLDRQRAIFAHLKARTSIHSEVEMLKSDNTHIGTLLRELSPQQAQLVGYIVVGLDALDKAFVLQATALVHREHEEEAKEFRSVCKAASTVALQTARYMEGLAKQH